ncbi:MAG: ABC transporter ATP-binding protein [Hyphomicrobiales bacterium]
MTEIQLTKLGKSFGAFTALADMTMTISSGEFVALLGPSGCGKSTTMNMIAGMLEPTEGDILFDGRSILNVPMAKRGVGFVFQNYAIFSHMNVRQNLAYGLHGRGLSAAQRSEKVAQIADFLQLTDLLDRPAAGLSVNILQRVAIGRSAVVEPAIFLLDEPLSNVDAAFRAVMRTELKTLQRQFQQTMVYVTHDQLEAMTMADRIAVMDHGKLLQVGTPIEVYNHPVNTFVARFLGSPGMNILPATVPADGGVLHLGSVGTAQVPAGHCLASSGSTEPFGFGFRPEQVVPDPDGTMAMPCVFVERIGARRILHLEADDAVVKASFDHDTPVPKVGEIFRFSVASEHVRLFDAEGLALPVAPLREAA